MSTIIGMGAPKKDKDYTEEEVKRIIKSKDLEISKLKEDLEKDKKSSSKTSESKKVKELTEQIEVLTKEKEDAIAENKTLVEQIEVLTKKVEELETNSGLNSTNAN